MVKKTIQKKSIQSLELLINELINTYDTKILDRIDKGIVEQLYLVGHQVDEIIKRPVLIKLISNHFQNKEQPFPLLIGGPFTLTLHWSDKYNKMVYIFGEIHSEEIDCDTSFPEASFIEWGPNKMRIEDFFWELIQVCDVFIDIFIEFPAYKGINYNNMTEYNYKDRLGKLLERLKLCIQKETRNHPVCELARVHYFDVRTVEDVGASITIQFEDEISNILKKDNQNFTKFGLITNKYFEILKELYIVNQDETNTKTIEFWRKQIENVNSYSQKELNQLSEYPGLKEYIVTFCLNKLVQEMYPLSEEPIKNRMIRAIFTIFTITEYLQKNECNEHDPLRLQFIYEYNKAYEIIDNYFYVTNVYIADAYLLARMFKKFNLSKDLPEGSVQDQPTHAHNIIIYAGNVHSNNYREFLNSLNFETMNDVDKSTRASSCVNISSDKFPKPFFRANVQLS
jgi:hypothetical protein